MNIENIKTLVRLGFEPARYFKRGTWVLVERVMEFLANKGYVERLNGEVKYGIPGGHTEKDIERLAEAYIKSPFVEHLDAMKQLSKQLGLPLNSRELLNEYLKTK